jgi:adenosine kinase
MGSIGKDARGEALAMDVSKSNVKAYFQVQEEGNTGACAVVVHGKERALCAHLGAAVKFTTDHLEQNFEAVKQASHVYATGFFITTNAKALRQIAEHCAESDKPFGVNLSAVFVIQFYMDDVKHAIEHADFVFCNEDEADAYGKAHGVESTSREDIAKAILNAPKKNHRRQRHVIITQGSQPVIVATKNSEGQDITEHVELDKIPKDKIVDTNGAGDSFVGAFYAALIQGKSVIEAVREGNKLAGHVVQRSGCTFE